MSFSDMMPGNNANIKEKIGITSFSNSFDLIIVFCQMDKTKLLNMKTFHLALDYDSLSLHPLT